MTTLNQRNRRSARRMPQSGAAIVELAKMRDVLRRVQAGKSGHLWS